MNIQEDQFNLNEQSEQDSQVTYRGVRTAQEKDTNKAIYNFIKTKYALKEKIDKYRPQTEQKLAKKSKKTFQHAKNDTNHYLDVLHKEREEALQYKIKKV